jgi:HlyD family secretion protein
MDVTETVSATGKIKPEVEMPYFQKFQERLSSFINEGDAVTKGDLLVRNPDLLRSVSRLQAGFI